MCKNQNTKDTLREEIDGMLKCSICIEPYVIPHILSCGHSYCYMCIWNWLGTRKHCPTCREPVLSEPIRNLALEHITEKVVGTTDTSTVCRIMFSYSDPCMRWTGRTYLPTSRSTTNIRYSYLYEYPNVALD